MNWRTDIEKARTAGPVLVWQKNFTFPFAAVWATNIQEWVIFGAAPYWLDAPTHWMPLPAPPVRAVPA